MNINAGFERFRGWNQTDDDREQAHSDRAPEEEHDNGDDVRYASEEGRYKEDDDDLGILDRRRERDLDEEAKETEETEDD